MVSTSRLGNDSRPERAHHDNEGDEDGLGSRFVVTPAQLRTGNYKTLEDAEEAVENRDD